MANLSRREFIGGAVALGAGWALVPRLARGGAGAPGLWVAGDLHCHTVYSHDVWAPTGDDNTGPDEAYTYGWTASEQIQNAELRGLDFLAVTDHDDARWISDGTYAKYVGPLTLIPGYEHSTSHGHAGCLGITEVMIDPATGKKLDTSTEEGATRLRDEVHALGGIFILNHPFYGSSGNQTWGYSVDLRPDSIEVWNIHWTYRRELFPGVSTSNNYKSLPFWESYLTRWGRMPASGGSDNHWRSTTAVQGVGQPTTWVFARDRSYPAILDGIRAGRTTISAEPPGLGGARAFVSVVADGEEFMVGDTVPAAGTDVTARVRVLNGVGSIIQLWVDGVQGPAAPVTSLDQTFDATVRAQRHVRAEILADRDYWMTALTSPIYFA